MKAITYDAFGGLDVLRATDLPLPSASKGHVLVRVQAVSINPIDGKLRRGELKLMSGTRFPKTIGSDFAGVVEAVGADVHGLAVGDAVYGASGSVKEGTLAEVVSVPAGVVAKRPASLDAATAASIPIVALAALQTLRDTAGVKAGARVLINGATGGVGLYAIQLAKAMGAHVTAVAGTDGIDIARSFGADVVVDYKTTPITTLTETFDAILELSGRLAFNAADKLLADAGVYVDFEPSPVSIIGNTLANPFRSHKHKFALTAATTADLEDLARRFDAGTLRAAPTRLFPFDEFRAAFAAAEKGGVVGKVVVGLG
jgi:NADPH:quinone reductase-like Zn-dependent oxidoreductase